MIDSRSVTIASSRSGSFHLTRQPAYRMTKEIFAEAIAAFYPYGKDRATLAILKTRGHS